ncbi:MAG TPA: hypothetical protein VFQ58_10100 [Flavisolibacter sp.]|nr:hypothetical protein [Flavisolibacter sp.]
MLSAQDILTAFKEGKIAQDNITLAACLGHRGARQIDPNLPKTSSDLELLLEEIDQKVPFQSITFRKVAIVRAVLAMVRLILPMAKKRRPHLYDEAFYATQGWTLCPCSLCEDVLKQLCRYGIYPNEPLELQMQYYVASLALDASSIKILLQKCLKFLDKEKLKKAVKSELLGWSLNENDPVRATIGERIFWWLNPKQSDPGVCTLDLSSVNKDICTELENVSNSLKKPSFDASVEIPVTQGQLRDMVPNELGLIIVSDVLKLELEKIKSLEFTPLKLKVENLVIIYWLVYSLEPLEVLHKDRYHNDQYPILNPSLTFSAPNLFRLDDEHNDCYLIDKKFILNLIQKGLKTGIYIRGTAFGCKLKKGLGKETV